ncbi:hypothetical protein BC830DRAFT_597746 [Chytriomyces sp. MP71]|nr:hypothetical protein BC830DRAFT_597746 [Chytriomyces sp. MP71]
MFSTVVSTFLNGTSFGSLAFVGATDTQLLLALSKAKETKTLQTIFPLWWPLGRNFMAPLGVLGITANIAAFYQTGERIWLVSAATHVATLVWTIVAMGSTIAKLQASRKTDPSDSIISLTRTRRLNGDKKSWRKGIIVSTQHITYRITSVRKCVV